MSRRTEAEQLEFQRKNPALFTTLTQSVNPDGTLLTYEQVTSKLRETHDKLVANARTVAVSKGFNADYWFLLDELADTKEHADYLTNDMKRALSGFVENYKRFHNA